MASAPPPKIISALCIFIQNTSHFVYNLKLVLNNNAVCNCSTEFGKNMTGKYENLTSVQLGCSVHCGKFKPVDIVVIDKTDSLAGISMLYQY